MYNIKKTTSRFKNEYYKIENKNKTFIKFFINNVHTPFGLDERYNKKIIKWELENNLELIFSIRNFENELIKYFKDYELYSKISKNEGFKEMLETNIDKDSFDIIKHEEGDVITFYDLKKNIRCNVEVIVSNLSINKENKKIYYNLSVESIHIIKEIHA